MVIVPKYRKRVLYGQIRSRLREILKELAKRKGVEIVEGNVMPDHVHMMLSIPPSYSVAGIIGYMKGKSAIWLHNEFGRKRSVTQKKFWSTGYFCTDGWIGSEDGAEIYSGSREEGRA